MLQVALESSRVAAHTLSVTQASQLAPSHPAWHASHVALAPCWHTAIPEHSNTCQILKDRRSIALTCSTSADMADCM